MITKYGNIIPPRRTSTAIQTTYITVSPSRDLHFSLVQLPLRSWNRGSPILQTSVKHQYGIKGSYDIILAMSCGISKENVSLTLSHCPSATLSLTLSHSYTTALSYCHTITLPHSYTATQSHCCYNPSHKQGPQLPDLSPHSWNKHPTIHTVPWDIFVPNTKHFASGDFGTYLSQKPCIGNPI